MPRWTAADVPDQHGRTVVVTGANSGIGLEAARELARKGATVVLACRNADKAVTAVASISASAPDARVETEALDLASLASVKEFARRFASAHDGLDLLINNAGVMAPPRRLTEDGFESQFGTNHLGHFALTALLITNMHGRPDARVVTVSSGAHRTGRMAFDDLHGEKKYGAWAAYGQSKLSNLLFMAELDRRLRTAESPVKSVAAHPGYAATNLQSTSSRWHEAFFMSIGNRLVAQSAAQGALPTLYAATHPEIEGGAYIGPDGWFEMRGHPVPVSRSAAAQDAAAAARLWQLSEELTGVAFEVAAGAAPSAAAVAE
jgi:NAD(P)-dependent dehydrogenase (short-subunit alcohol dehydrogenase family)